MMIDSYPIDGKDADRKPDDGWKATMHNLGDTSTQIRVFAVCTAEGKYRYVKRTDVAPIGESTSVKVDCPLNADPSKPTRVTGGGVRYSTGSPSQSLAATTPDDGPDEGGSRDDAWRVAVNNQPGSEDLPLTAYAICETSLYPLVVLGIGSASSVNTNATHTQTLNCGASQVLGGGVKVDPLNNAGYIEFTGPTVPNPGDGPDGWTSQVKNPGTNSVAWYDPLCYYLA